MRLDNPLKSKASSGYRAAIGPSFPHSAGGNWGYGWGFQLKRPTRYPTLEANSRLGATLYHRGREKLLGELADAIGRWIDLGRVLPVNPRIAALRSKALFDAEPELGDEETGAAAASSFLRAFAAARASGARGYAYARSSGWSNCSHRLVRSSGKPDPNTWRSGRTNTAVTPSLSNHAASTS